MKLNCTIDNERIDIEISSQKYLSDVIKNLFSYNSGYDNFECSNHNCGKCLVLIDGIGVVPSCAVSVLKLQDKNITTQNFYMQSDTAVDVQSAFKLLKISPCEECFKSKVMIFGFIVDKFIERDNIISKEDLESGEEIAMRNRIIDSNINMSLCHCLLKNDVYEIINIAFKIRRNHIV